jgi:putative PEP-CTERM system TPR-repeat lipoprotein
MRRARKIGFLALAAAGAASALWIALHPENLVRDAQLSLARGDLHAAQIDLDSYLKGHPHHPEASFQLGLVALAQDNGVAAERNFRVARDGGYDIRALLVPMGRAYALQRHYDQALADFTLAGAPADAAPQILTVRALALLGLHQVDDARGAIAQALKIAPDDPDAGMVAARIAFAGRRLDVAQAAVSRVVTAHPDRIDARLLQVDVTLAQGDAALALREVQSVLAQSPDRVDAKIAAARVLTALKRDDAAIALLDQVRRVAPRRIDAHYLRAILAVRGNDYATADSLLASLSPVIDQLPLGNYLLAVTKLARGQPAQAEDAASIYAARNKGDAGAAKLLALTELAIRRPDQALAALGPLIATGHADAETLALQARAQAMEGDIEDAATSLAHAAALAPRDADILNRLAAARLRLGDAAAGAAALRDSLAAAPDQPEVAQTLVQASLAAGDFAAAAAAVAALRATAGDTEMVGVLTAAIRTAALDSDGARRAYLGVLDKFPGSRAATFGLIQLDQVSGDTSAAHTRLAAWLQTHPADEAGVAKAAAEALRAGDTKAAIAIEEAAHAAAPADRAFTASLSQLYLATQQPQRAIALLDRAATAGDPTWLAMQAHAQAAVGNRAEARRLYLQAADASPHDSAARLGLLALDLQARDFAAARSDAAAALADTPGDPGLLEASVEIEQRAAGLQAALAKASALRADPRNRPAADALAGNLLAASGDRQGAAAAYAAAFRQAPSAALAIAAATSAARAGDPAAATALLNGWVGDHPADITALQLLASLAITGHRMDDAGRWLDQILAHHADNAVALNNDAWVKLSRGDLAAARALAQRAYIIAPGPDTEDTLGWIIARQGDCKTALPLLQQAAAGKPAQSILYHEAVALAATAQPDAARAALDRALGDPRAFDDRTTAEQLRKKLGK